MRSAILLALILGLALCWPQLPFSNTIRPGQPPREQAQPQAGQQPKGDQGQPGKDGSQKGDQGQAQGGKDGSPQKAGREDKAPQPGSKDSGQQAGGDAASQPGSRPGPQQAGGPSSGNDAGGASTQAPTAAGQPGFDNQQAEAPTPARESEDPSLSISAIGNMRPDATGKPLVIPEDTNDISFLDGDWMFDKELKGPNGESLRWDFAAKNGTGIMSMVDKENNRYEASMEAKVEDGVLRIRTDKFSSKTSPRSYKSEYIECRNGANGAECSGTDGFSEWHGERILESGSSRQTRREDVTRSSKSETTQGNFEELAAEGAELPPDVMENSQKATMQKDGVASLAGDWRYSQDLARKSDGAGVALEFHFGKDGNGYSIIKDGSGKDSKAAASSMLMKNGAIRVKTEAYSNGAGKSYYPTFMECVGKPGQDLDCNVSNGWMRSENGKLIDLNSYQENMDKSEIEELMATTPPAREAGKNQENLDDLFANAAEDAQKASSSEEASEKSQAASSSSRKSSSNSKSDLKLPERGDSVSFMEGKWICNTGLYSTDTREPVILEFSFNRNGKGTSIIREKRSGSVYRASAQASFRNGVLRVNTSQFRGRNGKSYLPNQILCEDAQGTARCMGKNGDVVWDARFMRKR